MGESKTMKRIRVLHSELNGELGGIESFLYNVYRFIDKEKVEFDFLTISDTPAYGDKFKKMGSTVYKVPKHINFLGYYFAIDKILREGNYDIVHAVTWFDVSENENAIANMIDLTKVPEETRYIRNREVAENGYDMQETANRLMKIYLSLIGE